MAIDYRQSGVDYRSTVYSYQGIQVHAITAAVTGTGTVTAAIVEEAFITAAITGSATTVTAIIETAGLTAAITGTAQVTAAITSAQFMEAAVTGTGTATAAIVREIPIPSPAVAAVTVTGAATVVAAIVREIPTAAAITGTATLSQPILTHRVPQPELTLTISNITGSSKDEEQQDTLTLLVGV
jgi:hypothetical protein